MPVVYWYIPIGKSFTDVIAVPETEDIKNKKYLYDNSKADSRCGMQIQFPEFEFITDFKVGLYLAKKKPFYKLNFCTASLRDTIV